MNEVRPEDLLDDPDEHDTHDLAAPNLSVPEPPPQASEHPAVWDLVLRDIRERDATGLQKYGTRLQPYNGRRPLVDLYQELLDAVVYLRQELYERYGK